MKKILFVITGYSIGGINSALKNYIDILKNDFQISLFSMEATGITKFYFNNCDTLPVIKILDLWNRSFSEFKGIDKIWGFLIKCIKQLVKYLHLRPIIYKIVARRKIFKSFDTIIAFAEGEPVKFVSYIPCNQKLAWVHCNLKFSKTNPKREYQYYKEFSKIIAVSKYTADVFVDLFPDLKDRIDYIYNLIDTKRICDLASESDSILSTLNADEYVITSIGRLDPIKRFSLIPKIAYNIQKVCSNFRWIIIGDGSDTEKQRIFSEITKYHVEDFVTMVGYKTNPFPILRRANLYVCTSKSEACPMVFLEANTLNTFIVSTDFPSAKEMINLEQGLIVPLDTIEDAIVERIKLGDSDVKSNSRTNEASIRKLYELLNN